MEAKIKKTYLLLGLLALFLSMTFIGWTFFRSYDGYLTQTLQEEGRMLGALYEEGPLGQSSFQSATSGGDKQNQISAIQRRTAFFQHAAKANPNLRITWMEENGQVLFDSHQGKKQMDNHLTRPEMVQAQKDGSASYVRLSATLAQKVYYYAQRLEDGSVLRVARSQSSIQGILQNLIFTVLGIFLLVFLLSALLASKLTRRLLLPLRSLYEGSESTEEIYPEILPLYHQLKAQKTEIKKQLRYLEEQEYTNNLLLQNMKEGLVLLSCQQQILLVNKRSLEIFGAPGGDYRGKNILHLTRIPQILQLLEHAQKEESGSLILEEQGSYYEYHAAPVYDKGGQKTGCLLLISDITHRQKAEKMRREFTANVSHELKTPLTSISGFAELMENRMAKEEDIPLFAGKIREESRRLISLIEDIIKLSHLDEEEMPKEYQRIDLYEEAMHAQKLLAFAAQQKAVRITVEKFSDEDTHLFGDKTQIEEMLVNLLDNAIKYNVVGGQVEIRMRGMKNRDLEPREEKNALVQEEREDCREKKKIPPKEDQKTRDMDFTEPVDGEKQQTQAPEEDKSHGKVQFLIQDTGIGIAKEHQGRIFERFYRVDKSRSKQTGGTGLGLSIVSHIIKQHGGTVALESAPGKGTKITVTLPVKEPGQEGQGKEGSF